MLDSGKLRAGLRYILDEVDIGDFVWVNEGNEFALCKVTSDWEVIYNLPESEFDRYSDRDIIHFREAEWNTVPYAFVPGYVRRGFLGPMGTMRNLELDEGQKRVIKSLYSHEDLNSDTSLNRKEIAQKVGETKTGRVYDILGSSEVEDIVISHLQSKGWRVIKSSTGKSQAKIECEMRTEEDGEPVLGYLQVKTGNSSLDPATYEDKAEAGEMIFFVESGIDVSEKDSMTAIEPSEIHEYIVEEYNYIPNECMLRLDFALS